MGLKAVGTFLEAPETGAFNVGSKRKYVTHRGRKQVASKGRKTGKNVK